MVIAVVLGVSVLRVVFRLFAVTENYAKRFSVINKQTTTTKRQSIQNWQANHNNSLF
jgi:hypothetical protein